MHAIAGKAIAFQEALDPSFRKYQKQVLANAQTMASTFMERGYSVVSGGTDNHLFLLDLIDKDITGKDADAALGRANITVNKNAIPFDPKPPRVTSGIRLGTPAITSRGFDEAAVKQGSRLIVEVLNSIDDGKVQKRVAEEVKNLTSRFPVPGLDH